MSGYNATGVWVCVLASPGTLSGGECGAAQGHMEGRENKGGKGGDSSADGAAFRTVLRATSDGASGQATCAVVSGASTAFRTVQKRGLSGPTWPRAGPAAGGSARVT